MNLLICPYNYYHNPIAGGEVYLSRLIDHLKLNHNIKVICGCKEPYTHNGIECIPQGEGVEIFTHHNDLCKWADVIVTQLIGAGYGYNKAIQHNKPLIFIAHNNSTAYAPKWSQQHMCHVIYNSYQLRDDLMKTFGHFNGTVLHPLTPEMPLATGTKITLVNCNYNKGGHILGQIAERLPQYEFVGVFGGYGEQYEAHLPNITYLQNGCGMDAVYADTRILLVPSEFESFSQAATEAMKCGIPVLANPTLGLRENMGDAGIFISRDDVTKYVETLLYLMNNPQAWQRQSEVMLERSACIQEKAKLELNKFDEWVSKIR